MKLFGFEFGKKSVDASLQKAPANAELGKKLRHQLIESSIIPQVRDYFSKFPALKSAYFLVAQYWSDEALDAVHYEIFCSELSTPMLNAGNEINLPTINELSYFEDIDLTDAWRNWDSNGIAISAFSCYCLEDCHQEMENLEAYSPYALLVRHGEDIKVELVGKMIRPWLDGVRPQQE